MERYKEKRNNANSYFKRIKGHKINERIKEMEINSVDKKNLFDSIKRSHIRKERVVTRLENKARMRHFDRLYKDNLEYDRIDAGEMIVNVNCEDDQPKYEEFMKVFKNFKTRKQLGPTRLVLKLLNI